MKKYEIIRGASFNRAYIKFVKRFPYLKQPIENAILELEQNCHSEKLKTHRLSGKLFGAYACSCGYDCRIVFTFEKLQGKDEEYILLADIGTHDSVY